MKRPRFCVGEQVCVRGILVNKFDIDCAEVIEAKYFNHSDLINGQICRIPGWKYKTDHMPDTEKDKWFLEESLKKLPPRKDPWALCIFNPSRIEIND